MPLKVLASQNALGEKSQGIGTYARFPFPDSRFFGHVTQTSLPRGATQGLLYWNLEMVSNRMCFVSFHV